MAYTKGPAMNEGLGRLVSVADFRELAKRRLPKAVFEFVDGGAEDEVLVDGALHPRWAYRQLSGGLPQFENVRGYLNDTGAGLTIAARVGQNLDAAFDWDGLKRIRDLWKGHLIVKGMMHADDAITVAEMGGDALWLSNHGGRQLDGAPASLDALEMIADRLDGRLPIVLDSGVRRGRDILKARALGATVVAVGRAALFGAVAGQAGVSSVLDILLDELALAMKLSGQPRLSDVKRTLLAPKES